MISNKENDYDNEDLKFIPINIRTQFTEKNSTWLPQLDVNNLQSENLNESFLINFENNINDLSLERRNIKILDNIDTKKALPDMKKEKFEEDFDLEYPSETYEEELYSYNKEDCKKINNNFNSNNFNSNPSNYNNVNKDINNKNNEMNNNKIKNNENSSDENTLIELDYYTELIHMSLLRDVDFNSNDNFRNTKNLNKKIDEIFNIIKKEESIIETFKVYNIPKPLSDLIIKKIIKISLENYEDK